MQSMKNRCSTARLLPVLALLVLLLPLQGTARADGPWLCSALSDSLWRCVAREKLQAPGHVLIPAAHRVPRQDTGNDHGSAHDAGFTR